MTQTEFRPDLAPNLDGGSAAHERCAGIDGDTWSLCLTSWQAGFAVSARSATQFRVLIGEPATRGRHPRVADQIRAAAAKLLEVRCSAADTVDVLCRVLARQLGGNQLPGPSLTVIDLHQSGQVDIACRVAPPVLHVGAHAPTKSAQCAGTGGVETDTIHVGPDDCLLALSPASVQALSTEALSTVPALVRAIPNPCWIRDELLDSVDGRGRYQPAPPMAIMRRQTLGLEVDQ